MREGHLGRTSVVLMDSKGGGEEGFFSFCTQQWFGAGQKQQNARFIRAATVRGAILVAQQLLEGTHVLLHSTCKWSGWKPGACKRAFISWITR